MWLRRLRPRPSTAQTRKSKIAQCKASGLGPRPRVACRRTLDLERSSGQHLISGHAPQATAPCCGPYLPWARYSSWSGMVSGKVFGLASVTVITYTNTKPDQVGKTRSELAELLALRSPTTLPLLALPHLPPTCPPLAHHLPPAPHVTQTPCRK